MTRSTIIRQCRLASKVTFQEGDSSAFVKRKDDIGWGILQSYPSGMSMIVITQLVQRAGAGCFHVDNFVIFSEEARGTLLYTR